MNPFLAITMLFFGLGMGFCAEVRTPVTNEVLRTPKITQTNGFSEEQRLLAAIPQLTWTRSYMVEHDWLKPGQDRSKRTIYFSKKQFSLLEVRGEIQFLFENDQLFDFSFYVEGDDDFSKLYRASEKTCQQAKNGPGIRPVALVLSGT